MVYLLVISYLFIYFLFPVFLSLTYLTKKIEISLKMIPLVRIISFIKDDSFSTNHNIH